EIVRLSSWLSTCNGSGDIIQVKLADIELYIQVIHFAFCSTGGYSGIRRHCSFIMGEEAFIKLIILTAHCSRLGLLFGVLRDLIGHFILRVRFRHLELVATG